MKDEGTRRFDRSVSVSEPQAATNPHKLRWYQYRLRTLLLLVLVVSVALSIYRTYRWWNTDLIDRGYDVADLVVPQSMDHTDRFDDLCEAIQSVLEPCSWDDVGGEGSLVPARTRQVLLVHHCRRMHKKVAAFLLKLRQQIPNDATDAAAAARREQANSADVKRLQGEWEVVACESDGRPVAGVVGARWRYEGRTCDSCSFVLDATKTPKWIDVYRPFLGDQPIPEFYKVQGVYALDGNSLTICESPFGAARPASLSAKRGDRRLWYVLRRANAPGRK